MRSPSDPDDRVDATAAWQDQYDRRFGPDDDSDERALEDELADLAEEE